MSDKRQTRRGWLAAMLAAAGGLFSREAKAEQLPSPAKATTPATLTADPA